MNSFFKRNDGQVDDNPPRYDENHLTENAAAPGQNHKRGEYKTMDSITP